MLADAATLEPAVVIDGKLRVRAAEDCNAMAASAAAIIARDIVAGLIAHVTAVGTSA